MARGGPKARPSLAALDVTSSTPDGRQDLFVPATVGRATATAGAVIGEGTVVASFDREGVTGRGGNGDQVDAFGGIADRHIFSRERFLVVGTEFGVGASPAGTHRVGPVVVGRAAL